MHTGPRSHKLPRPVLPIPFKRTSEINIGDVVFERTKELPAWVTGQDGKWFILQRPGGTPWRATVIQMRPPTPEETRQLRALAKLRGAVKR
jgi:hypothetical protein